uniref:CCHC-type domain-containing protein n=1 Tax=Caenorhabditis japonica TaxID=281687 RepID=A0A8R1IN53_CAEJA
MVRKSQRPIGSVLKIIRIRSTHLSSLSCDSVTDKASITTLRNAVCKYLHAAHERITDVFERIQVRVEKLEKEGATSVFVDAVNQREVTTLTGLRPSKHQVTSNSAKFHLSIHNKEPQGTSASPQGEQPVNPKVSDKSLAAAPFPGETCIIRVASSAARSNATVTEQSEPVTERDALQSSVRVIAQADAKEAAVAERTRETRRSTSHTSRISRYTRARRAEFPVPPVRHAESPDICQSDHVRLMNEPDEKEVRNHLLTVLTDFARDTAKEVLDRNPDATSEDIIDALRAQYEDEYSTRHRLDAIKACFQYAQEPVQDYYKRIRKLMREAQTGANRAEVTQVAKEVFRNGLQPDIRFYVTTARSTEFDQIHKDAIFFEKALQDKKKRKEQADAAVIANRTHAAKIFAQAAPLHQDQCHDYDNSFDQGYGPTQRVNNSSKPNQISHQTRSRDKQCWYCKGLAHYRYECRKMKADRKAGVFRSSIEELSSVPFRPTHRRTFITPLNTAEYHTFPTIKTLQTAPLAQFTTEIQAARSQIERLEHMLKMQENAFKDIKRRIEAYQIGRSPGNSSHPSANLSTPTQLPPRAPTTSPRSFQRQIQVRNQSIPHRPNQKVSRHRSTETQNLRRQTTTNCHTICRKDEGNLTSTAEDDKMEVVSRTSWNSDDDIEVDVSEQEEEEGMTPESEDERPNPAHEAEQDFPLPVTNDEVQVPAIQQHHPFHVLYAPSKNEEPPKDVAKRLVSTVLLSQVHDFRMKTLNWFDPIEKSAPPVLTPENQAVEQVSQPHLLRCTSYTSIEYQPRYARESTTGGAHSAEKFFPGDLLAVTRLGRLPNTTSDHFIRSQDGALLTENHNFWTVVDYTLIKRAVRAHTVSFHPRKHQDINRHHIFALEIPGPINVPPNLNSSGQQLLPGRFYRTTMFVPQVHPSLILHNVLSEAARRQVLRNTSPFALSHTYLPTLISANILTVRSSQFQNITKNLQDLTHVSSTDAIDSLFLVGRLTISAAFALTHNTTKNNHNYSSRPNANCNYTKSRSYNAECWYCGFSGHYRQNCRKRAADIARGIYRSNMCTPHNVPPAPVPQGKPRTTTTLNESRGEPPATRKSARRAVRASNTDVMETMAYYSPIFPTPHFPTNVYDFPDPSPSIASKQHLSRVNPSQSEQRHNHPKPSGMAERDPPEAVRPAQRPVRLPRQH